VVHWDGGQLGFEVPMDGTSWDYPSLYQPKWYSGIEEKSIKENPTEHLLAILDMSNISISTIEEKDHSMRLLGVKNLKYFFCLKTEHFVQQDF